jgi:Tfp pilus assembly protein PilW
MKQQVLKKTPGTLWISITMVILLFCIILIANVHGDTASGSSTIQGSSSVSDSSAISDANTISRSSSYTNYPPFDPDLQNASSITQFDSSTSYIATPGSSGDSTSQKDEVITESVLMLKKNQSAIQKINFQNPGTLLATSLSGDGFELYSMRGTTYPSNANNKDDYGTLTMVTSSTPASLDIAAGSWYFTVFPIGDTSTYDLLAIRKGTSSPSRSGTWSTYSSFVQSTPNTTRYVTSSSNENSQSSSEGFTTAAYR